MSSVAEPARHEVDLAAAGRLIGEPARAAMLEALMSGRALTAGELARAAAVAPATASEHLTRLRRGGLVKVTPAGRHRYYRIASAEVAQALESLSLIGTPQPVRSLRQSRATNAMLVARTCYDHLTGTVGVAVHDALVDRRALTTERDGYALTADGADFLADWGMGVAELRARRRAFARPCLDFTERRYHLAGALGAGVLDRMVDLGWVVPRTREHRALRITACGRTGLADVFGVSISV